MKQGDRVWVSGDSAALWIKDYHVRVNTGAIVEEEPSPRATIAMTMTSRTYYETGIETPEILGSGSTYSNVVYFPDEERAFEEFHHCGRNYLHRITYRKKSPHTTTEWWDEDLKCWRS